MKSRNSLLKALAAVMAASMILTVAGCGGGGHCACASSCACACACACAGGGRAGCSAQNLYSAVRQDKALDEKLDT